MRRPSLLDRPSADETGVAESLGVRIIWRRYGDGPATVLFVPTWNFVDSRVVRHQVDALREQFRVITYDARGSGGSDHPASGYSFDHHVADAVAVLDATQTAAASLVAASLGTHVAVLLAARYPHRVRRAVLIAPPMDVPGDNVAPADQATDGRAGDDDPEPDWRTEYARFVPWFIAAVFPEPGSQGTIDEIVEIASGADHAMLIQQSRELEWDEAPRHLGEIGCPTLVIHGNADRTLDMESVRAVAAAIPHGQLVVLEGLGHRPDIRRPDIVNPIVADFIGASAGALGLP
jgi:pimeloyl-ACP methyl ester carboxylesterase